MQSKVRLGDYCSKIGSGSTPRGGSSVYLDKGEYSLFRSQNIYNNGFSTNGLVYITSEAAEKLKNVTIFEDDILLNITGDSVARVCIAPSEFLPARVNQHVAIIRVNKKEFNSKFVRYYLSSSMMQKTMLSLASVGATRSALTKSMIEDFEIPKPELTIQKKIAHILSTLDDKIELNRKMNQTLEEMAQALFKSWFVDFDPAHARVTCKSEADLEAAATKLGISKEVLELFPSEFVESEMGTIPFGWEAKELGTLTNITSSKRIFSKEYVDSGIPFYRSKEIINLSKGDSITDILYISEDRFSEIKEKFAVPKAQDILITSVGTIGRIYLVPDDSSFYFKDGNLTWINDYKNISPVFIYYFLKSASAQRQIDSVLIGSTQKALTIVNINRLSVMMASKDVLDEFTIQAESIFAKISKNTEQTRILEKTRDTLLPKLLSGELDISNLELN